MAIDIAAALVKYKYAVIVTVAVIVTALAWQSRHFEIDASADTLLTRDNEKYIQSKAASDRFSPEEFLLVAYEPHDGELFSETTFDNLRALSRDIGNLERVASVRSILNVPLLTLGEGASISGLDPDELTVDQAGFSMPEIASTLRGHPIYEELLIDPEQTVTALQVLFKSDPELGEIERRITALELDSLSRDLADQERAELERLKQAEAPLRAKLTNSRNREIETIRELVAGYSDTANIYLGGVHVLGQQLVNIVRNDLVVFGSAIAAIVALLLLVLFRELRWIGIAGACCLTSIAATIGLFGLLGFKATVVSANFVALQLILTLALVVHLIVQYREFARANPDWPQRKLVESTMREKGPPSLQAGLTTAVGFGALLLSGFKPVESFGWMMIVAMAMSLAITLTLFPALLALFDRRGSREETNFIRRFLGGLATWSLAHKGLVATGSLVLLGLFALGAARIDVENSFIDYFAESTNVHRELTFIDRKLGGSTPMDIIYPVETAGGDLILSAGQFQSMQRLQESLEEHEAVGKILSLVNFTALARKINDGVPVTEYEMTAAYRVMDASIRESLVGSFFNPKSREVRISARVQDSTPGLDRAELLASVKRDARAALGDDAEFRLTNLFVLYQDILERLFRSQVLTLGFVLAALTLAFTVIFRSLRIALIAIVPNILVTGTVFGTMGWFGIPLDLMTITIAAVAMGIAVDDTIHYVHRYRKEAKSADGPAAVMSTHQSVGFAVLYTTVIVSAGFASLAFSDFVPSMLFGMLTALALIAALAFDLTVLPVLLRRFAPSRRAAGDSAGPRASGA